MIRNADRFKQEYLICPFPGAHKERWVLDTQKDYQLCQAIAERWRKSTPPSCTDILHILDAEPELRELNSGAIRNERFYEGLADERLPARTFERSEKLFDRAATFIPYAAQTFSKSYLQFPKGGAPLFVSHGDGARVFDVDGNDYVDLVGGLMPVVLGYRDPDVDEAIRRQLSSGITFSLSTKLEAELAETLCRLIPCSEMVRFGKNGSDVTSAAIRLARAHQDNAGIIIANGYHGWHDWAVTKTPRSGGVPATGQSLRASLEYILSECDLSQWAAVIVEPDGHDRKQLSELRTKCSETGCVLIFDEIITGFRWSLGGYQRHIGVTPDLACFGKSMANGMPISALVGKREIMKRLEPPDNVFYSGTFFGETLSIAAALATIKKMERENVIAHLWEVGEEIKVGVTHLIERYDLASVVKLTGEAPRTLINFEAHPNATVAQLRSLFIQEMAQSGVLIINANCMSYSIRLPEVTRIIKAYAYTLKSIRECLIKDGEVELRLKGNVTASPVRQIA